ncbi:bifunctional metallophosphatase/5'-nucleotidase [Bacillus chungangensis]|uniref:2',3'-cyclic-nucleotide 2'-phosphodiesterase (5'-nucleotidase family) n=1 Tax=Bacillus chungangensis TaxID=587633 RepID=A0ABT9WWQ0_9BACI|nr:bifunctional UDP-sugar hydrolase/5'-nucleotidase [Bacillus chungangensis]MDQ0177726.1 2',3'-cyclic-nucleotide 2'-phosphodiesterase (5'-nucleotidase family) [Bacillus chungangensis]
MKETIHIYHTNDIHSYFHHWPRIRCFLETKKRHHQALKETVFLFDIGDFMDRWHPLTEGTLGKGNVALLNEAGYTAVTIGNNEGITFPHEQLDQLYRGASFDVIVANLYDGNGERRAWMLPHYIYETMNGNQIGLIGITAYYKEIYEQLGWQMTKPLDEIERQLNILKNRQVDCMILLSHLGIDNDKKIAATFPEIDLIIGGHTHHVLPNGQLVNKTLLAGAGQFGDYIGYIKVTIAEGKSKKEATLIKTSDLPAYMNETEEAAALYEHGKSLLQPVIAQIPFPLQADWYHPSLLTQLLCEAIREWTQADCAFIHAGLLLTSLKTGEVTAYDLHQMLPHPINPCVMELTGAELKEVLIETMDSKWPYIRLKGYGFRGKVMGCFVYDRIEIKESGAIIFINGVPIEEKRSYTLATTDMFSFGMFFPILHHAENTRYFLPEFLRDLMAWKLKNMYEPS